MNAIRRATKWIMLIAGLLTCTMLYTAVEPTAALQANFGESLEGPVAQIVVRSWGFVIGLVGLMLIYGAFDQATRRMALVVAGLSKIAYVSLVLVHGPHLLQYKVGVSVVVDALMIGLFALCLLASRNDAPADTAMQRVGNT